MFHFLRIAFTKIIAITASTIIAVGIVHIPQISNTPIQITHKLNAPVVAGEQTTKNNTTTPPSPATKPPTPKSVVPSPIPVPTTTSKANSNDIADIVSVINQVAVDLATDNGQILQLTNQMNSDYYEFSPYLTSVQAGSFQKIILDSEAYLSNLSLEIINYQKSILAVSENIKLSDNLDKQYWLNTGIPKMVGNEKFYKQKIAGVASIYADTLTTTKKLIANNTTPPPTPLPQYTTPSPTALSEFQNLCSNVENDIRNEVSAGNGFATESQIQALAYNRKKSLGCYNGTIPTAECSDFTASYSTNRSGTCSDHGGVYIWF